MSNFSNEPFLQELDSNVYVDTPVLTEKELNKQQKETDRQMKKFVLDKEREEKKAAKQLIANEKKYNQELKKSNKVKTIPVSSSDDNSLYDENGTKLQGKQILILNKKIQQYKLMFKDELKSFKVKKNANEEELNSALLEMQTIVELGSIDAFMMDSVLQIIKVIESGSSITQYDLSGLSVLLNQNKEFSRLIRLLFLKYGCFASIPAEFSLILLIGTSSMICVNKNKNKKKIDSFLDEPITVQNNK